LIYLASIYSLGAQSGSELDKKTREVRYQYVMKRTAELVKAGNIVFSPILHSHSMAEYHNLPKSYEFFKEQDRHMIERSDQMVILDMTTREGKGWKDSKGVSDEESFANSLCRPIFILPCPGFLDYVVPDKPTQQDIIEKDFVRYTSLDQNTLVTAWDTVDQNEPVDTRYPPEE
jgi:hypothetical protein